jgi:ribosomal protein S18 acetylase RimI-like enzyme
MKIAWGKEVFSEFVSPKIKSKIVIRIATSPIELNESVNKSKSVSNSVSKSMSRGAIENESGSGRENEESETQNEEVSGYIVCEFKRKTIQVLSLAVRSYDRGNGVASKLMRQTLNDAYSQLGMM